MKPAPPGWSHLAAGLFYEDANKAIDWLCRVFGFQLRVKVDDGKGGVVHSELTFGDSTLMVNSAGKGNAITGRPPGRDAQEAYLMVYVDDVDAHHQRVVAAGAKIIQPLTTSDHGPEHWDDRSYGVEDLEGRRWWFAQRLREPVAKK